MDQSSWEDLINRNFEGALREVYSRALDMIFLYGADRAFTAMRRSSDPEKAKYLYPDIGDKPKLKYRYWQSSWGYNLNFALDVYADLNKMKIISKGENEHCSMQHIIPLHERIDHILLESLSGWFELDGHTFRNCESTVHRHDNDEQLIIRDETPYYFRGWKWVEDHFMCTMHAGKWMCDACVSKLSLGSYNHRPVVNLTQREKSEREKMTPSLRFAIMTRDNFSCKACGRSPREDDIKLHVDHIMPIAKGGLTVEDNLQTLCADCNLAKSDKIVEQMMLW